MSKYCKYIVQGVVFFAVTLLLECVIKANITWIAVLCNLLGAVIYPIIMIVLDHFWRKET